MSELISLSDIDREAAPTGDKETWKFLHGKATKEFVLNETTRIDENIEMIGEELKRAAMGLSQVFTLQKMLGLQLETFMRMLDTAVPNFRNNFKVEHKKTIQYSTFIDTLNNDGQHAAKPMAEKIDIVRNWNKDEANIKVKGYYFGLPNDILEKPTEYTEDQVEMLALEFDFPEIFDQYKTALAAANKPHAVPDIPTEVVPSE
jgi:hypothetical protein